MQIVELLINASADTNIQDNQGGTALIECKFSKFIHIYNLIIKLNNLIASSNGNRLIEQHLVAANATLDIKDNMGCSAIVYGLNVHFIFKTFHKVIFIFLAAMFGYTSIVEDLILAGADINSQTNDGESSLMFGKFEKNYLFYS